MPKFRYVEVFPPTGHPDRLMDWPNSDPVKDAFLRSSRGVTELYSEALARLDVDGLKSMLRLGCGHTAGRASDNVEVVVSSAVPRDLPGEMGAVRIPSTVGGLHARARAGLALDAVHAAVRHLAGVRGWEVEQFESCYQHVVDHDFTYAWASPWKSSPDRRHEARAKFRLPPDDGYGRACLEVRARNSGAGSHVGSEAIAFSTAEGFRRSASTVRWLDATGVTMTPYCGLGTADHSGLVRARRGPDRWHFDTRDVVKVRPPGGEGVVQPGEAGLLPLVVIADR